MKYKTRALLAIFLLITLILLSGCVSKSEYSKIQSDYDTLSLKLDSLSQEYQSMQSDYDDLSIEYANLQDKNTSLVSENNKIITDLNTVRVKLSDAIQDAAALQGERAALQEKLTALQNSYDDLQNDFQSTNDELTKVKAVFPPRNFASAEELSAWLAADDISDYDSDDPVVVYGYATELRRRALADGYIINVNVGYFGADTTYFHIYCTAQTQDNTLYFWDIRSDGFNILIHDVSNFKWATGY